MRPMNKENLCVKSYNLKVKTHVQKAITWKTYAYNLRILSMKLLCGGIGFWFLDSLPQNQIGKVHSAIASNSF